MTGFPLKACGNDEALALSIRRRQSAPPSRRLQRLNHQPDSGSEQAQHHQRIKQAGGLKIDAQIHNNAGKNNHGTEKNKRVAPEGFAVCKQDNHAEQKWNQRKPEAVVAVNAPNSGGDLNLLG